MNTDRFVELAKMLVIGYVKAEFNKEITKDDAFIVWQCKLLKNNKALVTTNLKDGMYYEITYNGEAEECYFDAYAKEINLCFSEDDVLKILNR